MSLSCFRVFSISRLSKLFEFTISIFSLIANDWTGHDFFRRELEFFFKLRFDFFILMACHQLIYVPRILHSAKKKLRQKSCKKICQHFSKSFFVPVIQSLLGHISLTMKSYIQRLVNINMNMNILYYFDIAKHDEQTRR